MDVFSQDKRSRIMARVKSKDTGPELLVRRILWRLGYRYRLRADDLPGKPDIVFRGRKKALFIHGCFWHGHDCKRGRRVPKTNTPYWVGKISRNRDRDESNRAKLRSMGWKVLTLWECELKDLDQLTTRLIDFIRD